MFSLIRSGPRILLIQSSQVSLLKEGLKETFGAKDYDLDTAFEKAREDCTILYLAEEMKAVVGIESVRETLIVMDEPEVVLCKLFKSPVTPFIDDVRTAPHILIMRAVGDLDRVMNQIQADIGGQFGSFKDILSSGNENTTLVALTEKPLNRNMSTKDLFGRFLKLEGKHFDFLKELRMHALKYLNIGIGNRDWYEIEIRIFDRYSAYKLHYERLLEFFERLELGFVLGESWSKDYPRLFMSVEVYRVRFFTFHDPKFIKRLLLGMEYLEDGTRIVDYDVYYNQKKMDWTEALEKEDPRSRNLMGLKYRKEIYSRLGVQNVDDLLKMEAVIVSTRD